MTMPLNKPRKKPYFTVGLATLVVLAAVLALVWFQFRGELLPSTQLTMVANRSGLSLEPGARVTYNGISIGRVAKVEEITRNGEPRAQLTLAVDSKYIKLIPANVRAQIDASTVFGNKYVVFETPKNPVVKRISSDEVIDVSHVTVEFNTLFQTVIEIAEKVDPVKLNVTLRAVAQALSGLGDKFGASIVNGNAILDDLNPQMPRLRYDIRRVADLADVYTSASPDLWDFLNNAVTTARTVNEQWDDLDAALLAAIGFGNTGAPVFEKSAPYLVRALQDLIPTSAVLDKYSPELFCTIRNYHDLAPIVTDIEAGNGYAARASAEVFGAPNPYVYPDNLPRVNARGGPAGAPGCWQPVTRDLWPAPMLVGDSGASIAPYNHFELGQPILTEYVWGRQVGENTINP